MSSTSGSSGCLPKLGDFTKIRAKDTPDLGMLEQGLDQTTVLTNDHFKESGSARLGDFIRLFSRLPTLPEVAHRSIVQPPAQLGPVESLRSKPKNTTTDRRSTLPTNSSQLIHNYHSFSLTDPSPDLHKSVAPRLPDACCTETCRHDTSTAREFLTNLRHGPLVVSTPSRDNGTHVLSPYVQELPERLESSDGPSKASQISDGFRSAMGRVLSYQLLENGPFIPIIDSLRSREQRRDSLWEKLGPFCAMDKLRAERYPEVGSNGVHVFLDTSNINISFHQTLRDKYSISAHARFTPLPPLDLQLLTEVLVRGRRVVALHAGCSIQPGRSEPRFVQELRRGGYRVDIRERKRVIAESVKPVHGTSHLPEKATSCAGSVRYVEDLVDETLQTRIAEAVMEHFQDQGTLVLATGDAQPAKYSDGFFTYAERALKMGWNVDVISWRRSLSSNWTGTEWTARWGDRFCVIELDKFVDDLLACFIS